MDVSSTKFDRELTLDYQEEIIRVWMRMPIKLTLNFNDHNVVAIEIGNDSRRPVFRERFEFIFKIYSVSGNGKLLRFVCILVSIQARCFDSNL